MLVASLRAAQIIENLKRCFVGLVASVFQGHNIVRGCEQLCMKCFFPAEKLRILCLQRTALLLRLGQLLSENGIISLQAFCDGALTFDFLDDCAQVVQLYGVMGETLRFKLT